MILLPIGHEQTTCKRLPWITFGLMIGCIAAFIASGRFHLIPKDDLRAARHTSRAMEYYQEHPYLELDERFAGRVFPGEKLGELAETLGGMNDTEPPGPITRDREQETLDQLTARALSSYEDHPFRRWGLVPGDVQPVTLFSHMFMHAGWMHLIGNLLILFLAGPFIEDVWGRPLYLGFYLFAGLLAALAHISANPGSAIPMVGASGAIAGVMGAFLVRYRKTRIRFFYMIGIFIRGTFRAPAWLMLPLWFAGQLFLGMMTSELGSGGGGVAYWAHVGGFAAGVGVALGMIGWGVEERYIRPQIDGKISISNTAVEAALDAQAAGNSEVAFDQLKDVVSQDRANHDAAVALWDLACEIDRIAEAAPLVLNDVAYQLRSGSSELALDRWSELVARVPDLQAPPALLLHLGHELVERERLEDASIALRLALLSAGAQPGGGLALRIARMAAPWDPRTARTAVRLALAREDLDPQARATAQLILLNLDTAPANPLRPV